MRAGRRTGATWYPLVHDPTTGARCPAAAADRSPHPPLLIVFLVVFIDLLGFGIVLPLLPRYRRSRTWPVSRDRGPRRDRSACCSRRSRLMQFVFAPMWGRISDRIGRRPVLLVGLAGSVVFYALFGFAATIDPARHAGLALALMFVVARSGPASPGRRSPPRPRSSPTARRRRSAKHGMALIGAAFGIGFTFGPLIGFSALESVPEPGPRRGRLRRRGAVAGRLASGRCVLLPETRGSAGRPSGAGWFNSRQLAATSADADRRACWC